MTHAGEDLEPIDVGGDHEAGAHDAASAPHPASGTGTGTGRGWYPDPWAQDQHRFWTGAEWTPDVFPNGPRAVAPPAPSAPGEDTALRRALKRRAVAAIALGVGAVLGLGIVLGLVSDVGRPSRPRLGAAAAPSQPHADPGPEAPGPGRSVPGSDPALPPRFPFGGDPFLGPTPLSPTPQAPVSTDPSASVLPKIVVGPADVGPALSVLPLGRGNRVVGEPTLDVCNATFPSESLRTARLQVLAADSGGSAVLSTEAVLYANPAAVAQARTELAAAAAHCPTTPVTSPVGEPAVTTRINSAPDGAWPATASVDRLALDLSVTEASGPPVHSVAVYLTRGRALLGIYFARPDGAQPAIGGETSMAGIVGVFANRLAALPDSVVNGG